MAGHFPPAAELTTSGRPVLIPNEVECSILSSVDLESDEIPAFPLLKSGVTILTTHRLLWISHSTNSSTSAVVVPLSAVNQIFSSKKSIKAIFASPRVRFQVSFLSEGVSRSAVITIVVRGKRDHQVFVSKFRENWRARAWENDDDDNKCFSSDSASGPSSTGSGGLYSSEGTVRMVGVAGILRKEQEMWENTDKSLQDAFQDLDALMLADFVRTPLDIAGEMISLIDIYCLFNRARGTELITPDDWLQACSLWEKIDVETNNEDIY